MSSFKEMQEQYQGLLNDITECDLLSEREMAIVALTVATVMEDAKAVEGAVNVAKELGLTQEQTDYLNLTIAMLKSQKIVGLKPCQCCSGTKRCC